MPKDTIRYQAAAHEAECLVQRLGYDCFPIDPFEIARRHGIAVEPKPSDEPGVSGFLMRVNDNFGIMYATHIKNDGFIKFTVSHELGHFFLPGHCDHIFQAADIHCSRSGFISNDPFELEADHFAASLLMPPFLFEPAMDQAGYGFPAIESLAETCGTSITATAIRYATNTDELAAVVVSSGMHVDYCFMSERLKDLGRFEWLRKGTLLPPSSETYQFNATADKIRNGERAEAWTSLDVWFDGAPELELKEDVVGLGTYGRTLTVLFTDDEIDDDDDE